MSEIENKSIAPAVIQELGKYDSPTGGLRVYPGDLIHADANGVVVIPTEIAEEVARACPLWIEAEKAVLGYLSRDEVTPEGLSAALEEVEEKVKKITGRAGKGLL